MEVYFIEKLWDVIWVNVLKLFFEWFFESEVLYLDREDVELSYVLFEMFSKKIFLEIGIVDEGVDIVDGFFEVLLMEFEVKWSFLMEDCEEFVS